MYFARVRSLHRKDLSFSVSLVAHLFSRSFSKPQCCFHSLLSLLKIVDTILHTQFSPSYYLYTLLATGQRSIRTNISQHEVYHPLPTTTCEPCYCRVGLHTQDRNAHRVRKGLRNSQGRRCKSRVEDLLEEDRHRDHLREGLCHRYSWNCRECYDD